MKRKVVLLMVTAAMIMSSFTACNKNEAVTEAPAAESEVVEEVVEATEEKVAEEESEPQLSDQELADECGKLIDAIYVQERTDETDAQCAAAKAAWDALTDEQKELVTGEEADPDYFGRDTGDASLDDSLNQDGIGENEILVVSFGTSFNNSRVEDISGVEKAIAEAYPDWSVRRAFTAQIIINHVQARDGEFIDNVDQALERAVNNGVKNLVVQPTHLMHGAEYDELIDALSKYEDKFEKVAVAEPLLGEVGNDATVINEDKEAVAKAVVEAANVADDTALVLMGHGTSHSAKVSYMQMVTQMEKLEYNNVFIGTVEGEPEGTACDEVIEAVKEAGYKKVVLRPLMVVAGDHANNDMAGEEDDSWLSMFKATGAFDSIDTQISGLGNIAKIKEIYVNHTGDAINSLDVNLSKAESESSNSATLEDGVYTAKFDTDSSMFHVNEANNGLGELTVADGKMTIHISLAGDGILNLYPGTAEDAAKDGAELLMPTKDSVTYSDGMTEEVNGFDIPVPYLDKEFDVALIGKKEKWYDHKVIVSDPVLKTDDASAESKKKM